MGMPMANTERTTTTSVAGTAVEKAPGMPVGDAEKNAAGKALGTAPGQGGQGAGGRSRESPRAGAASGTARPAWAFVPRKDSEEL